MSINQIGVHLFYLVSLNSMSENTWIAYACRINQSASEKRDRWRNAIDSCFRWTRWQIIFSDIRCQIMLRKYYSCCWLSTLPFQYQHKDVVLRWLTDKELWIQGKKKTTTHKHHSSFPTVWLLFPVPWINLLLLLPSHSPTRRIAIAILYPTSSVLAINLINELPKENKRKLFDVSTLETHGSSPTGQFIINPSNGLPWILWMDTSDRLFFFYRWTYESFVYNFQWRIFKLNINIPIQHDPWSNNNGEKHRFWHHPWFASTRFSLILAKNPEPIYIYGARVCCDFFGISGIEHLSIELSLPWLNDWVKHRKFKRIGRDMQTATVVCFPFY